MGYLSQSIEKQAGFGIYQVGVSLPLFLAPLRGRLEAARLQSQVADRQLSYQQHRLRGELTIREQQFRQSRNTLAYYETSALPQANLILRTAEQSYLTGDIEYLEFVQSTTQAWQIREQYLNAVAQYNQSFIEQEALAGYTPTAP